MLLCQDWLTLVDELKKLVDVLSLILEASYFQKGGSTSSDDCSSLETWPSKKDAGHIIEFIIYYVACERAKVSRDILSQNLEREKQLLTLLEVVLDTDWDAPYLLHFFLELKHLPNVCGLIHSNRCQYVVVLDSYIKAVDESIHAFSFIHDMLRQLSETDSEAFQAAVFSRIGNLVKLDRKDGSLHFLSGRMAKHQSDRMKTFLEELNDFPKLLRSKPIQLTDEVTEQYLESCHHVILSSYRVENCLCFCQEYGIVDAASFLLERINDVGSALMLILSGLNKKFSVLEASIGPSDSHPKHFNSILKEEEEVNDILDILHSCIGLYQRNSSRLDPHESEYLWFQLLDSFCLPLMDSCSSKTRSIHQEDIEVLEVQQDHEDDCIIKWTWSST
ncbi:unnamed protein product [Coffea canephora]|uniref:Uncharacterized protein n=1 Tax=Coffea canephora TaxID=49390 RepID=A0A068V8T4_COFCA|nr:unnamed protein product [Coffea canephora]